MPNTRFVVLLNDKNTTQQKNDEIDEENDPLAPFRPHLFKSETEASDEPNQQNQTHEEITFTVTLSDVDTNDTTTTQITSKKEKKQHAILSATRKSSLSLTSFQKTATATTKTIFDRSKYSLDNRIKSNSNKTMNNNVESTTDSKTENQNAKNTASGSNISLPIKRALSKVTSVGTGTVSDRDHTHNYN